MGVVELEASEQLNTMPSAARRGLMKALTLVGSTCEDQASKDQYWGKVLKPLNDRFNAIIQREDLKKVFNEDKLRSHLAGILESIIGVIQVISCSNISFPIGSRICSQYETSFNF